MATVFRLLYKSVSQTFAEWGISNVVLRLESQGIDSLTFAQQVKNFDSDFAFDYLETIILLRDDGDGDVRFFYGVVTSQKRTGSASDEGHSYVVSNPAWHLSRIPFAQNWKFLKTGATLPLTDASYETIPISVLLLNARDDGSKATSKPQLTSILDYAISVGVPLAYDSTQFPDVDAPIDEVRDMAMSECINRELRWAPDCVTWWDYTTEPYPTMHIARRGALTAVTLNVTNGERVESIELDPLNDLLSRGVILTYQTSTRINDSVLNTSITVKAPNVSVTPGVQVLQATINLEGSTTNYAEGYLQCTAVNAGSLDWWKERIPLLAKANVKNLNFAKVVNADGTLGAYIAPTRGSLLANEIVRGEYAPWMGGSCESDTIEGTFSFTLCDDAGNTIKEVTAQSFNHRCNVTNLATGTRRSLQDWEPGEPIPANLHTYLYEAASVLHYAGQIVLSDEECPGDVKVGNVLNITGARAEWAAMNALVQSVVMDLDNRTTTIQVGPPTHLGFADIIEWMRSTRFRMRYTPTSARSSAQGGTSGAIQMPDRVAKENTQQAHASYDQIVLGGYFRPTGTATNVAVIDVNKADIPSGEAAKFRKLLYCEADASGNPVQYELYVLCTAPKLKA